MITLEIPEPTPSNNELMREYAHPRARMAEQERWNYLIRAAMSRGDLNAMLELCEIVIHRFGSRPLDWDNMGGGCKFTLDALRHNNLITDDKPKVVKRLHLEQHKVHRKDARTLVEIIPLMVES